MEVILREATPDDLREVTSLFRETVKRINSADYSEEQIQHWISSADDLLKWKNRILDWYFIVAEIEKSIVGFAYLNNGNYFDGLFVHHEFQSRGVATLLADKIELKVSQNGFETIHSDVSITAKPFFEKRGYNIEGVQEKVYRGMVFKNYLVSKML